MGRKSRRKKELRQLDTRKITLSEVEVDGRHYKLQEIHPSGTEPLTSEEFGEAALVAQVGYEKVVKFAGALSHDLPESRVLLMITEDYVNGISPINVALYPRPSEEEMDTVRRLIKEFH